MHSYSILEKLVQNAKILIGEGYYDRLVESVNQPISLVERLQKGFTVIGEFKKSAPNTSAFFNSFQVDYRMTQIAMYSDALSVITEPNYFLGSFEFLKKAQLHNLPVLMKDFIIDIRQIDTAIGSSAILLIDRILSHKKKNDLIQYAHKLNLEVVLEVDNRDDFERNLDTHADIIGINNRDLTTFEVETEKTIEIFKDHKDLPIPVLGFSGYSNIDQVIKANKAGLSGVLIGSALSRLDRPQLFLQELKFKLEDLDE